MSKPRKKPTRARKKPPEPEQPVETLQEFKRRMLEENRIEANARFDAERARVAANGEGPEAA